MNDSERLECLQSLPADTLLKGVVVGFTVNVDGDFAPNDAIVPLNVEETILKGNYDEGLNLLIGSNTEEGLLLTAPTYLDPRYESRIKSIYYCKNFEIYTNNLRHL